MVGYIARVGGFRDVGERGSAVFMGRGSCVNVLLKGGGEVIVLIYKTEGIM